MDSTRDSTKTLLTTLKKVVDATTDNWDDHISAALYAYRVSQQASSKFSPFFLMYNRHPHKAVSLALDEQDSDEKEMSSDEHDSDVEKVEDIDGVVQRLVDIRQRCHHQAKENIGTAQQKQKRQYVDKKHNALKVSSIHIIQ